MSRLRVAPDRSGPAIPIPEARDQMRGQYEKARDVYVDLLAVFGEAQLRSLLRHRERVTVPRIRATRDAAQRLAERALAVVSALDACLDIYERADR
jgi:hypothetical protein